MSWIWKYNCTCILASSSQSLHALKFSFKVWMTVWSNLLCFMKILKIFLLFALEMTLQCSVSRLIVMWSFAINHKRQFRPCNCCWIWEVKVILIINSGVWRGSEKSVCCKEISRKYLGFPSSSQRWKKHSWHWRFEII